MRLEIVNNITNGVEVMEILIVNFNIESFFAKIYEVCKFERIDSEIRCQFGFHSYVIGINATLVNQKLLQIFKHIISSFVGVLAR